MEAPGSSEQSGQAPGDAPPPSDPPKNKPGRPPKKQPTDEEVGEAKKPRILKLFSARFREMPQVGHHSNSNTLYSEKDGLLQLDTDLRAVIWHVGSNKVPTAVVPMENVVFCVPEGKR